MCGTGSGSVGGESCRGRCDPYREDYLPGGISGAEVLWDSGRARLFEVVQKVAEVNEARRYRSPGGRFQGSSSDQRELRKHPELALIT